MSLAAADKARTHPNEIALADERLTLTWAELDPMLNRATNALLSLGLGPNERIAIYAPNSVEAAFTYLASLHAGVSSVPVNYHFTAEEVAYILKDSGARALFVAPETEAAGREAAAQAGVPVVIGWRCNGEAVWPLEWLAESSDAEPPTDMPPRPHLHYTSGTTGRPKGVETPPNMFPRTETVRALFQALTEVVQLNGATGPGLVVSPLYHTGPLGAVRQLAGGIGTVLLSRFDAEGVLAAIDRHKIRSVMMVPTHFQRLLALPQDVKRRMIDWFGPILLEAYGATESGATNLITSEEWLRKPGSVGMTQPPFELLVISEDGEELGPGEVGQLYFRDTTGRGIAYHNDAEKTRAAHLAPGVFTLGEVGYVDKDGYVFITDRTSDMIVSGGVNIYPAEAEQVLLTHPGVSDVAVIGVPNAEMGEEAKALIVPRDWDNPPDLATLDRFCRVRLASLKCPRTYEFRRDIGRNAMGKVNKRQLRRPFWPSDRTIGG